MKSKPTPGQVARLVSHEAKSTARAAKINRLIDHLRQKAGDDPIAPLVPRVEDLSAWESLAEATDTIIASPACRRSVARVAASLDREAKIDPFEGY